jgi:ribosomal protein S18 acetylase RimI-like enzyme
MILRFLESCSLSGYAAEENGCVVGYSFYVCEGHKGLIGNVFVTHEFQGGPIEVQLLTHVLETVRATPGIRRIEAQLISTEVGAVRDFLSSQGFQVYDRKFLFRPLDRGIPELPPNSTAFDVTQWNPHRFLDAAKLISRAYDGHVDSSITDQYRTQAGAARFLENVVHYPGCGPFQPETSFLAFYRGSGVLCGMLLTSAVGEGTAHITQLCVAPEAQGRGLGCRLVLLALGKLLERGFHTVTLTVTLSNNRAIQLYEQLGFSALSAFPAFSWDAAVQTPQRSGKKLTRR